MIKVTIELTRKDVNQTLALIGLDVIVEEERWSEFENLSISTDMLDNAEEKAALTALVVAAWIKNKKEQKPKSQWQKKIDEIQAKQNG